MVDRTGAAHLISGGLAGDESEPVEHLGQADPGSGFGEVNAGYGSVFGDT